MKFIRWASIIIALVMAVASLYFRSARITLSVIAGAAIVISSFELTNLVISRTLGGSKRSVALFVIIALLKLTLLGFVLWFLVVKMPVHALAFIVGLTTMIITIGFFGLYNEKD